MTLTVCAVAECGDPAHTRGWCRPHYRKWNRYGDPLYSHSAMARHRTPERFWGKVDQSGDCWTWQGNLSDNGYGLFHVAWQSSSVRAHRYAWELENGPIPEGIFIDHACRNRSCVNPAHLRLATKKQNGENLAARGRSGIRGVDFNKKRNKWRVQVTHNGRWHDGGHFENIEDADRAARALRNRLFTYNILDRSAS